MRMPWLIPWVAVCLSAVAAADDKCPWLNRATAQGVLDGKVTRVAIELSKSGDHGRCDFIRAEGSISRQLFIEVETLNRSWDHGSYDAQCASPAVPLKAIGNEAIACTFKEENADIAEQVAGRVRDQMFLVRLSTTDRTVTAATLREKARKVAEQIAGFLF